MGWLYALLALSGGAALAVQAVVNSALARGSGSVLWAAIISYLVGLGGVVVLSLVVRVPWPAWSASTIPWWAWTGGLFGAFYVATAILVVPRLGAAALIALIIAGQLLASLLLDHFGGLGLPERDISLWRLVGAGLLVGGVLLIRSF